MGETNSTESQNQDHQDRKPSSIDDYSYDKGHKMGYREGSFDGALKGAAGAVVFMGTVAASKILGSQQEPQQAVYYQPQPPQFQNGNQQNWGAGPMIGRRD